MPGVRPHVVVDGVYGLQSYGDDAMLLALRQSLRERDAGVDVTVLSRHPRQLSARYGVDAIANLDHPERVSDVGYWFYGFNPGQPRDHIARIRDTIAGADLLVIGGGNLLLDVTDDWLRGPIAWHWFSSEMARIFGVPYVLYANSIGPFRTDWGRARSAHIVKGAAAVTVRDETSLALAEGMRGQDGQTTLLPDPALTLESNLAGARQALAAAGDDPAAGGPRIAVSVRDLSWLAGPTGVARYVAAFQEICNRLVEDLGARVIFVPQCSYESGKPEEDDRLVARAVCSGIRNQEHVITLTSQYRADEIMGVYRLVDAALTTRLHGAVFSAAARTPFVAVDYLPKVRGFLRRLSLEQQAISLEELGKVDDVVTRVDDLLVHRDATVRMLDREVGRAVKAAVLHFDVIWDVLCRRRQS